MKFDKAKLDELAKLPDKELWATIRTIAEKHGVHLPDKEPSHTELEKIRGAISGTEKISPIDAMRIINQYKKKG